MLHTALAELLFPVLVLLAKYIMTAERMSAESVPLMESRILSLTRNFLSLSLLFGLSQRSKFSSQTNGLIFMAVFVVFK